MMTTELPPMPSSWLDRMCRNLILSHCDKTATVSLYLEHYCSMQKVDPAHLAAVNGEHHRDAGGQQL